MKVGEQAAFEHREGKWQLAPGGSTRQRPQVPSERMAARRCLVAG